MRQQTELMTCQGSGRTLAVALVTCLALQPVITSSEEPWPMTRELGDIRIRDPFVLADESTHTYYMYAQMGNRGEQAGQRGVEVYASQDLQRWSDPRPVFVVPDPFWAGSMVWAPEVHKYRDRYYLLVTLTGHETLPPVEGRPKLNRRGTQILVGDTPTGPFLPFRNAPHTPPDWMALDGTLWVEEGTTWLVFCHEWVQLEDGTMELVRLRDDLSATTGDPITLFRASDAPWVRGIGESGTERHGYVTDGPFLYRTKADTLIMIWSSFGEQQYAVGMAVSSSGKIIGPWRQIDEPLFAADGGHGMIFRTFEGQLMLALHQPNSGGRERARFIKLQDTGDLLQLE